MYTPMNGFRFSGVRQFFVGGSVLSRLILVNILVFIVVGLLNNIIFYLFRIDPMVRGDLGLTRTAYWLAVPSDIHSLTAKPWTLITYMFFHENFFHILFNLLMLYFGGYLFSQFMDGRKLLVNYLAGGLAGAFLYIFCYNVFPVFSDVVQLSVALGASAAVLSVLVAAAAYAPDFMLNLIFFGRVRLKYVALALVILDLISISKGNPGGHIAHLGGALWGFSYVFLYKRGNPFRRFFASMKASAFFKTLFPGSRNKFKNVYHNPRPLSDDEYNARKAERQKRIDAILDKISKSGYDSLTREEKDLLFGAGKDRE